MSISTNLPMEYRQVSKLACFPASSPTTHVKGYLRVVTLKASLLNETAQIGQLHCCYSVLGSNYTDQPGLLHLARKSFLWGISQPKQFFVIHVSTLSYITAEDLCLQEVFFLIHKMSQFLKSNVSFLFMARKKCWVLSRCWVCGMKLSFQILNSLHF